MAENSDLVGGGRVVAPTALAVVATLAAPPKGLYNVAVHASVSGNAAADTANMKLQVNGADYINPIEHGISGGDVKAEFHDVDVDGVHALQVLAVGAGTASIVYSAEITATPTG